MNISGFHPSPRHLVVSFFFSALKDKRRENIGFFGAPVFVSCSIPPPPSWDDPCYHPLLAFCCSFPIFTCDKHTQKSKL